jgi:putative OPT family oligopeptide transporter
VAAGAVFTIPAFVISGAWARFDTPEAYWKSTALMLVGGILGILFVTLLRRVMVEDPELPYPESVAASQIHIAGQQGSQAARILFYNMGAGTTIYLLGAFNVFQVSNSILLRIGDLGKSMVKLVTKGYTQEVGVGGATLATAPAVSPAYLGVGYIIGPRLAALNFSGGVVAWGLLVPLLAYFLGPQLQATNPNWELVNDAIWKSVVKQIAVGGMLVGACYTLFRMRKSLASGMGRALSDLRKASSQSTATNRLDRDLSARTVFAGLFVTFLCMVLLYFYFSGTLRGGLVAALVMIVLGFFFAAVSGNLVGLIGSSNNPVSGLTLATLVVSALLMVALGVSGPSGVAAVLGVAAVVCVSSAVAGEMLQDLKVGHILGGTPRSMQIGDILGVLVASAALYFPLLVLHQGFGGFGSKDIPAPQAGLMASLAQGIVGGNMAWPLIGVGVLMGLALIMLQVRSPMLFAVGMYLPLETTFAIFIGGILRWVTDQMRDRRQFNDAQKARVENAGVLTASGLIAGEAMAGLVIAAYRFRYAGVKDWKMPQVLAEGSLPAVLLAAVVLVVLAVIMTRVPLANAGRPDEPAPPTAIM